ncbi:MAG: choice-of-anchor I family protein, partial [Planctomycetes bacterium]|nr:choice-of-anchor I family protein [Planctomycetota bacterium]
DSDADGDTISITGVTQPTNATVTIEGNLLRVSAGANLSDANFTYTISDGEDSDTATVTMGVVPGDAPLNLVEIGTYRTNIFDAGVAEISAYDALSKRLFVVNGNDDRIDVLSLANPSQPSFETSLNIQVNNGAAANSVATFNGIVAVAVEQQNKQDNGQVLFFNASTLQMVGGVSVGALPDMVTFSPDGKYVVTANEGEPIDDYTVDPEGSISVITLPSDISTITQNAVRTAGFAGFNGMINELRTAGVRIFGPNATVAQDLEPEYVAINAESTTAWVSLQENNAFAIVDLASATVTSVKALGYKDHSKTGHGLDASDRDAPGTENGFRSNITTWPVWGMYQPDTIAAYSVNGATYIVSANEGDARAYGGFDEEARVSGLNLDPVDFPVVADSGFEPQLNEQMGRLRTTSASGDLDGDNMHDVIYSFGARSFSIWDAEGNLVWDSGDFLERYIHINYPDAYNINDDVIESEARSDDKGVEPEALTVANFNGRWFAFVGLERQGGIFVFDITNPQAPRFVQYTTNRNLTPGLDCEANLAIAGDIAPEGLIWIKASDSPLAGIPLVVVSNEVSGSVTIYAAMGESTYQYPAEQNLSFTLQGSYQASDTVADEAAAEIVGFDPTTNRVFTVNAFGNRVEVTSLGADMNLTLVQALSLESALAGGSPNSLSIKDGVLAVAIENAVKGQNGVVAFYSTSTLELLSVITAGVLPDMVTFTPDGSKVLVANEGESYDDNGMVGDP